MRLIVLLTAVLLASTAQAAGPDYFPLKAGNQWVLETAEAPADFIQIEVLRSRIANGQEYFLVTGYALEDLWLRKSSDGVIYALNKSGDSEQRIAHLAFGAAQYRTNLSGCEQFAQPAQAALPYPGPGGPALPVQYNPGLCRDAGFLQELYADGTGLTQRSVTSIRGPRTYNLVYARIDGKVITSESKALVLRYDFAHGSRGWLAGFTDYALSNSDLRMEADVHPIDEEQNGRPAFYVQSMNRSDDLFMYLKKEVTAAEGLEPNRGYRVAFDIELASNAPTGCVGAGGAPGESVYLKAGATANEPVSQADGSGHLTINIDKGQQASGGKDAGIVSDIANGRPCDGGTGEYVPLRKTYAHPQIVRTDDRGVLWLTVGTDSGYEGLTGLYYRAVTARITPAAEQQ